MFYIRLETPLFGFEVFSVPLQIIYSGLTKRKGSEITMKEFDDLWACCGGGTYVLREDQ